MSASKEKLPGKPGLALEPLPVALLKNLQVKIAVGALGYRHIELRKTFRAQGHANRPQAPGYRNDHGNNPCNCTGNNVARHT